MPRFGLMLTVSSIITSGRAFPVSSNSLSRRVRAISTATVSSAAPATSAAASNPDRFSVAPMMDYTGMPWCCIFLQSLDSTPYQNVKPRRKFLLARSVHKACFCRNVMYDPQKNETLFNVGRCQIAIYVICFVFSPSTQHSTPKW